MSAGVLILDIDFQPLRIMPWTDAITAFFLGKVEVIEYSRDKTIRGVSREYPMPSVVRILRRFKRDKIAIKFSRVNIYTRDHFTCQYCDARFETEDLTFDHVVPRSHGGKTEWANIVTCCVDCNNGKANRTPEQAGMPLKRKPKKPRYLPVVSVHVNYRNIPEEWKPYWTAALEK